MKMPSLIFTLMLTVVSGEFVLGDEGPVQRVSVARAEIRVTENGSTRVIAVVPSGTQLWPLEANGDFFRVIDPASKQAGWIWKQHVREVDISDTRLTQMTETLEKVERLSEFISDQSRQPEVIESRRRYLQAVREALGEHTPRTAEAEQLLADAYYFADDMDNAISHQSAAHRIVEEIYGRERVETADTAGYLALMKSDAGDSEGALPLAEKAVEIREQLKQVTDSPAALTFNRRGVVRERLGRQTEAIADYNRALRILDSLDEADLWATMQIARNLISAALALGQPEVAEKTASKYIRKLKGTYVDGSLDFANLINEGGIALFDQGQYEKASSRYREAISEAESVENPDELSITQMKQNLASSLRSESKFAEAKAILSEVVTAWQQLEGADSTSVATALNELGVTLFEAGEYKEAEKTYQKAIDVLTRAGEIDTTDFLTYRENMANLLLSTARIAEAAAIQEDVLKKRRKADPAVPVNTAYAASQLAQMYRDLGRFSEAESLYRECIALRAEHLGEEHADTLTARQALAYTLQDSDRPSESAEQLELVLKIRRTSDGEQASTTAAAYADLGWNRYLTNQYSQADSLLNQALQIQLKTDGEDSVVTALTKMHLGVVMDTIGRCALAEQLLRDSAEVYRKRLGDTSVDTAVCIESLAGVFHSIGDYDQAESLYRESLKIKVACLGENHLWVADAYNALGLLNDDRRRFSEAEELHRKALAIRESVAGPNAGTTSTSLHNLGSICLQTNRYEEANEFLLRGVAISERLHGSNSIDVALTQRLIGSLRSAQGRFEEARTALEQALKILRRGFGPDHPRVADTLQRLTEVCVRQNEITAAIAYQDAAAQAGRRHLSRVLPGLSEFARQRYLTESHAVDFERALALGFQHRDNPRASIFSAGWLLNGKAAGGEALAEAALLAAPEAAPFVYELRSVRDQISALSVQAGSTVNQDIREKLAALESQQQRLQQKISSLGLGHQRSDPWLTTGELLSRIPVDAVMINIARFRPCRFEANDDNRWQDARYVAWIIPPVGFGEVRIVDLGDAAAMDELVATLRQRMLSDYFRIRSEGETVVEAEFRASAAELSRRLFAPLENALGDAQELIISPDGALWTLPWDALVLSDGRYLTEKFRTRYVLSGRELIYPAHDRSLITSPVVFAAPEYGKPRRTDTNTSDSAQLRSIKDAVFPPLQASAAEAAEIKPSLEELSGESVRILLGEDASETAFKALHRPRVLVLSTHGYFDDATKEDSPTALQRNPLQRCGLALAGANERDSSAASASGNDGILTGLEIIGTDLRGTELVVLSACETGLGSIQVGEGVVGLRHSFQLAGVQSVLSSLWQVDDTETARLMAEIFRNLAGGARKSQAVHEAQLSRIEARRKRNGAAHPFFWAAFTLTGSN